jgi:hypothetical protein
MEEKIQKIINRDEVNGYVMSCFASQQDLYRRMRADIHILVEYIKRQEENRKQFEAEVE